MSSSKTYLKINFHVFSFDFFQMMYTMNNEDNEYCLRWHKHSHNFMENFEALLANESLADVSFLVDDGSCIKAHKVVLSFCSNYFQNLFKETMDKYPIIILKDVLAEHLRMLLEFMYTGQVNIPQEALDPLMNIAQSLRIKGLVDGVVNIAKVPENENETPLPLINPKSANSHYVLPHSQPHTALKPSRTIPGIYNTPSTSVLSNALTMPALSLASPLMPHLANLPASLASSIASTLTNAIPQAISSFLPPCDMSRDNSQSPLLKRRRRQRRRSGDAHDSGDSDARSSGSPGDNVSNISLPKIPATITPVGFHHRQHMQHLNSHLQQQQQPRDLSMHAPQNQTNAYSNHDRPIHFSPFRDRPPSIKIPPNIPGLLHHPPIENHSKPQEEPENLEHRPQKQIKEEGIGEENASPGEERLNNQSQSTNSSPHEEKSSPLTSGRRSEERSSLRVSPKFSSDPESLVSPAKGLQSRLEETSSDNNHFSEEDRDENNTMTSQKENSTNDRLSDSTPGPSTSRPQSEEAPPTPNLLWPYSSESNISEEHYPNLPQEAAAAANHEYVKALLRAGFSNMLPPPHEVFARPGTSSLALSSFVMKGRDNKASLKGAYPYPEMHKQFSCDKCGRSYASTGNLKRHKKYECGVEPQFSCPICQKKFQHRHSVKIHVFSTHRCNEAGEPAPDGGNKDSKAMYPNTDSVPTVVGGSSSWTADTKPIYPTTDSAPAVGGGSSSWIAETKPIYPTTDSVPTVGGGSSSWIAQGKPAPPAHQQE